MHRTHWCGKGLVVLLVAALAMPVPVWSAGGSLGTARGVRAAELSLDGGAHWMPLAGRSLPVLEDARIRSTSGGVLLDLADGSRVNVLPYSTIRVRERAGVTEIVVDYGRLTFRLPDTTRVAIETPSARLEPVRGEEMVGEVFASDATGLKMTRGRLQVRPTAADQPVMLAALEPVFLPKRPAISGPLFTTDATEVAPAGARGIFNPKGESLGYVRADGQLVVYPGFTADLTSPFAPRVVQVAMASIPDKDRAVAEPLFDVNGHYLGYVAGPVFYAQAQPAAPAAPAAPGAPAAAGVSGVSGAAAPVAASVVGGLAAVLGVGGLGIAAGAINDSNPPVTRITP